MPNPRIFERSAKYLISATRGGPTRAVIMHELLQKPQNPNRLAEKLGLDYKTITHHLQVLRRINWVTTNSDKYGEVFSPTFTEEERAIFERICAGIGKKL